MSKKAERQLGSAPIVIIGIVIVAIVAALGFILWKNLSAPKDTATEQTNSQSKSSPKPSDEKDSNEDMVVINDWKIKFKLEDSLMETKVLYFSRATDDMPSTEYYAFTTARIQALGGKCTERPFGDTTLLYRYTEKPAATPDGELVNDTAIGGYYYVLSSPIARCSGFDANGQMKAPLQTELDDAAALKELIRSVTAL